MRLRGCRPFCAELLAPVKPTTSSTNLREPWRATNPRDAVIAQDHTSLRFHARLLPVKPARQTKDQFSRSACITRITAHFVVPFCFDSTILNLVVPFESHCEPIKQIPPF